MTTATLHGEMTLSLAERDILVAALKRSKENAHRHALIAARMGKPDIVRDFENEIEDIIRLAVRLGLGLL